MSYAVDLQLKQDYVRAEVTGRRQSGDAAVDAGEVGEKIVELCRSSGVYRALVILNLSGRLSAIDSFEIVINSKEYGWRHGFRLAFVDSNEESFQDIVFTETVAVNRAYAVKAFCDETAALAWLVNSVGSAA